MLTILDPKAEVRETHDVSLLLREAGAGTAGVLLFSDLTDFDRFVAEVVRIHSQISLSPAYVQFRQPDFEPGPPHTPSLTLSVYTDGASRSNPGPAACAYVISGSCIRGAITYKQYLGPRVTNNVAEYQGGCVMPSWELPVRNASSVSAHFVDAVIRSRSAGSAAKRTA